MKGWRNVCRGAIALAALEEKSSTFEGLHLYESHVLVLDFHAHFHRTILAHDVLELVLQTIGGQVSQVQHPRRVGWLVHIPVVIAPHPRLFTAILAATVSSAAATATAAAAAAPAPPFPSEIAAGSVRVVIVVGSTCAPARLLRGGALRVRLPRLLLYPERGTDAIRALALQFGKSTRNGNYQKCFTAPEFKTWESASSSLAAAIGKKISLLRRGKKNS